MSGRTGKTINEVCVELNLNSEMKVKQHTHILYIYTYSFPNVCLEALKAKLESFEYDCKHICIGGDLCVLYKQCHRMCRRNKEE